MTELALALVVAVPLWFYLSTWRSFYFLNPINTFWPLYLMFGVYESFTHLDAWNRIYGDSVVCYTILLHVLLGLCVCVGYRMKFGRRTAERAPINSGPDIGNRYLALGVVMLALGVYGYVNIIAVSGGIGRFLATSRTGTDFGALSGYEMALTGFIPVGLCLVLCLSRQGQRYRMLFRPVLIGFLALLIWDIYSGTRSGVILALVLLMGGFYGTERRNPPAAVVILGGLGVIALVGFTAAFRGDMFGGRLNADVSVEEGLDRIFASFRGDEMVGPQLGTEFSMACAVVTYVPDSIAFNKGRLLLELLTRPIPRSVWPEKIYPEGEAWSQVHEIAGTATWRNDAGLLSGPAPGAVGKLYYIAGPIGVILGGLLTGIMLQFVYFYTMRFSGVSQVFLSVSTAMLGFGEMNNPMLWPITWLPTTGLGIVVALSLCRVGRWHVVSQRAKRRRVLESYLAAPGASPAAGGIRVGEAG
ncbi:hypothetical protein [Paludibaculum fermentans]|uniref:hypothetical protein n=1 Tax=Paludibaculum fermentans TaxID=1473598 RepID=UPI003EC11AEB